MVGIPNGSRVMVGIPNVCMIYCDRGHDQSTLTNMHYIMVVTNLRQPCQYDVISDYANCRR